MKEVNHSAQVNTESTPSLQPEICIVPMTEEEFSGKNRKMTISYSIFNLPTGKFLIASTHKGICFIMPAESQWSPVETLKIRFPHFHYRCQKVEQQRVAAKLLKYKGDPSIKLMLHIHGTPFQLSVWQDLLNVPIGKVTTYRNIAKRIGKPRSARPVGRAVGNNPVMCIIPCHRVICSNGKLGGYRWNVSRKIKLLNKEAHVGKKINGLSNWEPTLF